MTKPDAYNFLSKRLDQFIATLGRDSQPVAAPIVRSAPAPEVVAPQERQVAPAPQEVPRAVPQPNWLPSQRHPGEGYIYVPDTNNNSMWVKTLDGTILVKKRVGPKSFDLEENQEIIKKHMNLYNQTYKPADRALVAQEEFTAQTAERLAIAAVASGHPFDFAMNAKVGAPVRREVTADFTILAPIFEHADQFAAADHVGSSTVVSSSLVTDTAMVAYDDAVTIEYQAKKKDAAMFVEYAMKLIDGNIYEYKDKGGEVPSDPDGWKGVHSAIKKALGKISSEDFAMIVQRVAPLRIQQAPEGRAIVESFVDLFNQVNDKTFKLPDLLKSSDNGKSENIQSGNDEETEAPVAMEQKSEPTGIPAENMPSVAPVQPGRVGDLPPPVMPAMRALPLPVVNLSLNDALNTRTAQLKQTPIKTLDVNNPLPVVNNIRNTSIAMTHKVSDEAMLSTITEEWRQGVTSDQTFALNLISFIKDLGPYWEHRLASDISRLEAVANEGDSISNKWIESLLGSLGRIQASMERTQVQKRDRVLKPSQLEREMPFGQQLATGFASYRVVHSKDLSKEMKWALANLEAFIRDEVGSVEQYNALTPNERWQMVDEAANDVTEGVSDKDAFRKEFRAVVAQVKPWIINFMPTSALAKSLSNGASKTAVAPAPKNRPADKAMTVDPRILDVLEKVYGTRDPRGEHQERLIEAIGGGTDSVFGKLDQQAGQFQKDPIVFIGDTGSGKSTLTVFLLALLRKQKVLSLMHNKAAFDQNLSDLQKRA
ncbi:MAG: hypothetical protein HQL15_11005, partial [Candidatus Omnitrophica bacterium]|nr:hypothetical protein [Candidatus Omnitrophota bacterium]